jgi:hypothetical protein
LSSPLPCLPRASKGAQSKGPECCAFCVTERRDLHRATFRSAPCRGRRLGRSALLLPLAVIVKPSSALPA